MSNPKPPEPPAAGNAGIGVEDDLLPGFYRFVGLNRPIEERIGEMIGKIIFLALCAFLLWGYSTTFLAQLHLL